MLWLKWCSWRADFPVSTSLEQSLRTRPIIGEGRSDRCICGNYGLSENGVFSEFCFPCMLIRYLLGYSVCLCVTDHAREIVEMETRVCYFRDGKTFCFREGKIWVHSGKPLNSCRMGVVFWVRTNGDVFPLCLSQVQHPEIEVRWDTLGWGFVETQTSSSLNSPLPSTRDGLHQFPFALPALSHPCHFPIHVPLPTSSSTQFPLSFYLWWWLFVFDWDSRILPWTLLMT